MPKNITEDGMVVIYMTELRLIKMPKSSKSPMVGDVFVAQFQKNVFIYGKVIKRASYAATDVFVSVVYKKISLGIHKDMQFINCPLLVQQLSLTKHSWASGELKTIRNDAITPDELSRFKDYFGYIFDSPTRIVAAVKSHIDYVDSNLLQNLNSTPYTDFARELAIVNKKNAALQAELDEFNTRISPLRWVETPTSVCFDTADDFRHDAFDACQLEGSGHDWEMLAKAFVKQHMPELKGKFRYDSEAGMFCALGSKKALKEFAVAFRQFCSDESAMRELLTKVK